MVETGRKEPISLFKRRQEVPPPTVGAGQFYHNDSQRMVDAVDRLLVRVHSFRAEHGKNIVLLTGCGSGGGTTMIAIDLAVALSLSGWNTLLIDADLRKSGRYKRLGVKAGYGLSEFLEGRRDVEQTVRPSNYENLSYIPAGNGKGSSVRLLYSERMEWLLRTMGEAYDFVVIDTPSLTVTPDATVLFPHVDGIALVAALGFTTKVQLADARQKAAAFADKYYGLIVNRVDQPQYAAIFPQLDYFKEKNMQKKFTKRLAEIRRQNNQNGGGA